MLLDACDAMDHDCAEHLQLRTRIVANGHAQFVHQCLRCGEQRGGPVGKAQVAALTGGGRPPPFDDGAEERVRAQRRALLAKVSAVDRELLELRSPAYAAQVATERAAAAGAEQRAASAIATAVQELRSLNAPYPSHRLQFIVSELLKHQEHFADPRANPATNFQSEDELKQWLDGWLERDFEVWREVRGRHLTEDARVQADYVLAPRAPLVDAGFKPGYFGLEVKYLPLVHGFSPKASRFVWQAVSYTDCSFDLDGKPVRLPRVLLFSNLSFEHELRQLRHLGSPRSNDRSKWDALVELANHANVGQLEILGDRDSWRGWKISFAGGTYFSQTSNGSRLHNKVLFEKVRIGNF